MTPNEGERSTQVAPLVPGPSCTWSLMESGSLSQIYKWSTSQKVCKRDNPTLLQVEHLGWGTVMQPESCGQSGRSMGVSPN